MSSSDRHADHEALSGFVDGEAPEWADHIAACAVCQASAEQLRAVAAAVARPVDAPSVATREAAIAAALQVLAERAAPAPAPVPSRHAAERDRFTRRRATPPTWAMPAVAAVVVGLLGLSGFLVVAGNRSTDEVGTFAGPAPESDVKAGSSGLAAATPPPADLGDVPDAATLLTRARSGLPGAALAQDSLAGRVTSAPSTPGAASGAAGGAALATPTTTLNQRAASPSVVGTRPCEEQARAREPRLGAVVYFATARQGQVEAYVLGFNTTGGPSLVTLLLLGQDGCRELLRSAGP